MKRFLLSAFLPFIALAVRAEDAPDFSKVFKILDEHCVECHAADDFEGGLVLETYEALMKGGENGKAVIPGKSAESSLIKWVREGVEKDGKKKFMPPGKRQHLDAADISILARWIDAGALPATIVAKRTLDVPKIAPTVPFTPAVTALAYSPAAKLLAVGRYGVVELVQPETRTISRKLEAHAGNVNALLFSADGRTLYAASGENAVTGQVKVWSTTEGKLLRTIEGHRDTIYAMALSPDEHTLATGSYDQQIKLWDTATGAEKKTLRGHNGAVFSIAYRPDGKILASASADRTVKLWDAETGQRKDTLIQPQKEQTAVAWSADGKRLAAAGFDNRIRIWEVRPDAKETQNPLVLARFAHEQPIARLAWSADGKTLVSGAQDATVKLWDAAEVKERALLEMQPDWPNAFAFVDAQLFVGRLDGSYAAYRLADGQPATPPAAGMKPSAGAGAMKSATKISKAIAFSPRGIQRGGTREVRVLGENLAGLRFVAAKNPDVQIQFADGASASEARLWVTTSDQFPRGPVEISLVGADGKQAGMLTLHIDDLPVVEATEKAKAPLAFPLVLWSHLQTPGESDRFPFDARAGQTLVFELSSRIVGSKADAVLALVDAEGHVLARSNDFDSTGDPLVSYTFTTAGRYAIEVNDLQMAGSPEHFYRLTAGELAFVTGCYPLSVPAHTQAEIELIGFNLPAESRVKVMAQAGQMEIPLSLDPARYRTRTALKVQVSNLSPVLETEPNNLPAQAHVVSVPASIGGCIRQPGDVDCFRFEARQGSIWAIEVAAARRGTPLDSKIEILDTAGHKVPRVMLQAVRDSAITFRAVDSNSADARVDNWREMELNQLMYMNGEVAKIFRMPEGPDSGFQFYTSAGKRRGYFDTTPIAQALEQPTYIVEPLVPGAKVVPNGLPVFTINYENDDDGDRKLGTDSRLLFTAPQDGAYLVRVSDSRGLGGDRYVYRLDIRPAQQDFAVALNTLTPELPKRSGTSFTLTADRKDGFDDPIAIAITGIPDGYLVSNPLLIEKGHDQASGTIQALEGARPFDPSEWAKVKITATATIAGQTVSREVRSFTKVTLGQEPKVWVALEPAAPGDTLERLSPATPIQRQNPQKPFEITIAPGEIIPAWIKIERNGTKDAIRFDVENLPHGVIVDNLGLNGITLLPEQSEGEIQIKAEPWVAEMDRIIYAKTRGGGARGAVGGIADISSLPVVLHVRHKAGSVRAVTVK